MVRWYTLAIANKGFEVYPYRLNSDPKRVKEKTLMWDQRYATDGYVYGTEPNDFLRQQAQAIPKGKVLCLADGEGPIQSIWLA